MSTPCEMASVCRNSPDYKGEQFSSCALCRLSPDNAGRNMTHFWNPIKGAVKKHPGLRAERSLIKAVAHMENLRAKYGRDKKKVKVSRLAASAEKKTERNIIKATKNSGRSNKDGDHVLHNTITLDTKLQTTRANPIVLLSELEKVRRDAKRAGFYMGALVIRNRNGVGVVVMLEEDYAELSKHIHGG